MLWKDIHSNKKTTISGFKINFHFSLITDKRLSLKRRFSGCGHGFGRWDGLGKLGGFSGFSGLGGFGGFDGLGGFDRFGGFSAFGGFGGFVF